ncbi:MAG: hypothetical protein AB7V04_07350 [Desulfomonilaceae bacterium]
MSSRTNMIFFFLGLLSLICLLSPVNSISSGVGRIGAVEGEGSIRRADQSVFTKLHENADLDLGDTISTDANARTYINFSESCHASLGEYSELCLVDSASERSSTYFHADLSMGIGRFIQKLRATSPPSRYSITTPNVLVVAEASETPSDFVIQVHNVKKTCVTVIRGQVRVKNLSDRSRAERLVSSCKTVFVEEEQEPSKVLSVSTDHLKKLIERTTIPNTLVDSVPECKKDYVLKPECPRCSVWDGTKCVVCGDFGLICSKGKCVDVECGRCKISWNSKCLSCQELGLVCQDGRCVTKKCPPCRIWDATRCVRCEDVGRICVEGRCLRPNECPSCAFWNGRRCMGCLEFGMMCLEGRCVFRPCGPCEIRFRGNCESCEKLGMRCQDGRCVAASKPEKGRDLVRGKNRIELNHQPGTGTLPLLPPAQNVVPSSDRPPTLSKPERPSDNPPKTPIGKRETPDKSKEIIPPAETVDKSHEMDRPSTVNSGVTHGAPKALDVQPGPKPRPMPEAPKLDQRRDQKLERQKNLPRIERAPKDQKDAIDSDKVFDGSKFNERLDKNRDLSAPSSTKSDKTGVGTERPARQKNTISTPNIRNDKNN